MKKKSTKKVKTKSTPKPKEKRTPIFVRVTRTNKVFFKQECLDRSESEGVNCIMQKLFDIIIKGYQKMKKTSPDLAIAFFSSKIKGSEGIQKRE